MRQTTLYPQIAAVYREELENTLDELSPKLLDILYCYRQKQTPISCDYCKDDESNHPCKYLLLDPEKLIEILETREALWEIEKLNSELLQDGETGTFLLDCVKAKGEIKSLYKDLSRLFSNPRYSLGDRNFIDYFRSKILNLENFRKGKRIARRKAKITPVKNVKRFVKRLMRRRYKDSEETLSNLPSLFDEYLKLSEESLSKLDDWYEKDKRFEKVEELSRKLIHVNASRPLKVKRKKVGDRRITYFTDFELDTLKNRSEEPKPELKPLGSLALDTFLVYSNPTQQYSLLEKQRTDLKNRIKILKWKLNSNTSELRNLERFVDLDRKSPVEVIKSIPSRCYHTLDETVVEIVNKVELRKSRIQKAKKIKYHDKKTRKARQWIRSTDPNGLERKLKETWKISKILEELKGRLSSVSGELNANFSQVAIQPRKEPERIESGRQPEILTSQVTPLDQFEVDNLKR